LVLSTIFKEHIAKHKNSWGISKNETLASTSIPFYFLKNCIAFIKNNLIHIENHPTKIIKKKKQRIQFGT
jgi:hypothetical protein